MQSPGLRKALQAQFVAHPERVEPADAAYALRALAFSPAFPEACDWLFSHRAEGLDEVTCPVTVGWGSKDTLLLPRQAPRFGEALGTAQRADAPGPRPCPHGRRPRRRRRPHPRDDRHRHERGARADPA